MEIETRIIDEPYRWKAGFSWEEEDAAFLLLIRISLRPSASATSWQLTEYQKLVQREFQRYFDQRFLISHSGHSSKALHCSLEFSDEEAHLTAQVHPGIGEMDLTNWYLQRHPIHIAHELGHQLGLLDEYEGAGAPYRIHNNPAEAFQDHSLMGNFAKPSLHSSAIKKADLRLRHGIRILDLVSQYSTNSYQVEASPSYIVRQEDGLSWISMRYFGTEDRWQEIYQLNRDQIPHRDRLLPGTVLSIPK